MLRTTAILSRLSTEIRTTTVATPAAALSTHSPSDAYLNARNFLLKHRSNYEHAYHHFQWPRVGEFNWATDYFDLIAKGNRNPALWLVGPHWNARYSFDEMYRRSNQVAMYFASLGLKPFDRVMLMLPNRVELWESMLASIKSAAVMVPTSTTMPKSALEYRIKTADVKFVITTEEASEKFEGIPGITKIIVGNTLPGWVSYQHSIYCAESFSPRFRTEGKDDLFMFFTSGTTANPKGVRHTHQSYPIGHLSTMYALSLRPGDVHLNIAQAGWAKHAWSSFFTPWIAEACVFSYAFPHLEIPQLLSTLNDFPITSFCAPPTVWRKMREVDLSDHPTHLRQIFSAGEPLHPDVMKHISDGWNLTTRQIYGQTETTGLIAHCLDQEIPFGDLGYPMPGYRVTLLDEDNHIEAQEGELLIERTNTPIGLMPGYHDEFATNKVMTPLHYHTGDKFRRTTYGGLSFIGRNDNLFKTSGHLISPIALESLLMTHKSILEAAVVPSPHFEKKAIPKAFVVLKEGQFPSPELAEKILNAANEQLPPSHRIRILQFCKELPKTHSGKILHRQLQDDEAKGKYPNDASDVIFRDCVSQDNPSYKVC